MQYRLRIISDGLGMGTKILTPEGVDIAPAVSAITWHMDAKTNFVSSISLELVAPLIEVDLTAEHCALNSRFDTPLTHDVLVKTLERLTGYEPAHDVQGEEPPLQSTERN